MNEPTPTVIVATEHESVVRFYAGFADNGGMHQTGQFTISRPIDPTDLANMAVDLSHTFGWLQVQPLTEPTPLRSVPSGLTDALRERGALDDGTQSAPVLPPSPTGKLADTPMQCPLDPTHVVSRQNMHRHLTAKTIHGLTYSEASRLVRELPRPTNAPPPAKTRKATPSKWKQRVACPEPGCDHESTRSNMTTHLQGNKHKWSRSRANQYTATMPAIDGTVPAPARVDRPPVPKSTRPRGAAGAAIAANVTNPQILAFIARHGTATSRTIAAGINHPQPLVRKHLSRMHKHGLVVDVSPPGIGGNEPHTWALPPVESTQRIDSLTPPMYDGGSTQTVHERNDTNP